MLIEIILSKKILLALVLLCIFSFGVVLLNTYSTNTDRESVLSIQTEDKPVNSNVISDTPQIFAAAVLSPTPVVNPHPVYFGMWTQGFWDESTYSLHTEKLIELQNTIGKKVAIAHYYRGWVNLRNKSVINELNAISSNGWIPMLSVNPYFFEKCPSSGKPLYKTIAEGNCDNFLHEVGRNLKRYGKPLFLRFAWEMNIPDISWSLAATNSSSSDFIRAWRRFHDIVGSERALNVLWVFCPNTEVSQSISYNALYPGDQYVDWLGLDGYNWGTTQAWTTWQDFSTIFSSSYNHILSLSPSKPLMIAEVNTTDVGGDKAAWYKDMLTVQIPLNFGRVKAIVFYNEDRTAQEHVNWLITVTPLSLAAFSEGIKNPMYLSTF